MGNVCARDDTEQLEQDNQPVQAPGMVAAQPVSMVPGRREPSPQAQIVEQSTTQRSMLAQSGIASDWETTVNLNKATAKVIQAIQSKNVRRVNDFPELKEYYAHPTATLKNLKNQDTYQGQAVRGVPEGWGTVYGLTGEVIEGLFKDGQPHSHLRYFYNDGTHYDGHFKDGKFQGEGTYYRFDGSKVHSKTWVSGKVSGHQEEFDVKGKLVFSGAKDAMGLPVGKCTVTGADFSVQGEWKEGKPAGNMIKEYQDGRGYRGQLNKDMIEEGNGETTFVDGRKFKGPFVRGVPHGKGTLVSDSGKESNQTWINGRRVIA